MPNPTGAPERSRVTLKNDYFDPRFNKKCESTLNDSSNNALAFNFQTHNQFHNILRLFDVLPNLPFTISETMGNYYL